MLKRWEWGSLALILALACFSLKSLKGITQEWRRESERALFGLGLSSVRPKLQGEGWRGMDRVFIVFSSKIAVGRKGTRRLRATLVFQPGNSTRTLRAKRSGVSGPIPGVSGLGREKLRFLLFWIVLWLTSIYLGSIEHLFQVNTFELSPSW